MNQILIVSIAGPCMGALAAFVLVHRSLVTERGERIRNVAALAMQLARLEQLLEVKR